MKILFHLNSMGRGGAERVVSILSQKLVGNGHEVVVSTLWNSEKEYVLDPKVRRISVGLTDKDESKNRINKIILRYTRLRAAIKREHPDLVISFCNKANFRSAVSMLGMNIPLLVSVRNNPIQDYKPYKISTWIMEHKVSGCVFQTPDAQKFFSQKLQSKSCIIFNPLSENFIEKAKKLEVKERKKEIVNVGRISSQKNQMLLVRAFKEIADSYPEYKLKIYGDVQEESIYKDIKDYIEKNNLNNRVFLMGTSDTIQEDISNASLFVLSSDYEGMPNALIESMALGIPSISTDCPCGGSAMLINQGVSGLLVPVGDFESMKNAIVEMLSDSIKAEKMGEKAKTVIDKVNPDRICKEWEDYISSIC